jgi:hypothetical protein
MRAILIDPRAKTVSEVECTGKLDDIYRLTRCTMIQSIALDDYHHMYLNEEGLLAPEPEPFFAWAGGNQPFCGCGLVMGSDDEGEEAPCRLDVELVRAAISFPHLRHTGITTTHEDNAEMPWGGTGFRINITPHFEVIPSPGIHEFADTSAAYSACQSDEIIKSGDILVVDQGNGFGTVGLAGPWPVAVTAVAGALNSFNGAVTEHELKRYHWTEDQVRAAVAEAVRRRWSVAQSFKPFA